MNKGSALGHQSMIKRVTNAKNKGNTYNIADLLYFLLFPPGLYPACIPPGSTIPVSMTKLPRALNVLPPTPFPRAA